jgi:O-antigen/teichoic acid export membrane protein
LNRIDRAAKGFLTSIVLYLMISLSQVLLAPFILRVAGTEVLGAYSFIMQILGIGVLLDLGLSVALSRFLAQSYVGGKLTDDFIQFLNIGTWLVFFTNALVGILLIVLGLYLEVFLEADQIIIMDAQLCIYILGVWYLVRTPFQIYIFATHATQNMSMSNFFLIVANIIRILFVVVLISYEFGLIGMVTGYLSSEFIGMLLHRIWFRGHFYQTQVKKVPIDKKKIKDLFSIGFKYWGVNLAQVLGFGTDSLIVGKLFGVKYIAMIYLTKMPAFLGIQIIYKISDNAAPAFNELFANNSTKHTYNTLCNIIKATAFFALPFSLGTIFFTDIVLDLWVGSDQYVGILYVVGLGCIVVTQSLNHVYSMAILASGNLKGWAMVTAMSGVITCVGAFILAKQFGFQWIIIPAALAQVLVCIWLFSRVCKIFSVKGIVFFTDSLVRPLKSSLFLIVPFAATNHFFTEINFAVAIFLMVMLFVIWIFSTFYLGLNFEERARVITTITTKLSLFTG